MICPSCQAVLPADSVYCGRCGSSTNVGNEAVRSSTLTMVSSRAPLSPDTLLAGRYRIIKIAGRGGMGVVYEAEDTKLGRHVALKLLPHELIIDPGARKRFIHEARAAAGLESPNICTVYEIHDEGGDPFISMEFIEGASLRESLNRGPLGIRRAVDIAIQVAKGLQAAGRKGIIHRDIKSANIMLTRDGQAKIMDFGLAKVAGSTMLTKTGAVMGTAAYMSPEQGRGECVDGRTDIWSLGVVLYEMLSGQLPFKGDSEASVLYAVLHEQPQRLREIHPAVPEDLDEIVHVAMAKKPEERYSSAGEMLIDLRKCLAGLGSECEEEPTTFGLPQRSRIVLPVALTFAVIILAVVWLTSRKPDSGTATTSQLENSSKQASGTQGGQTPQQVSDKELLESISRARQAISKGDLELALAMIQTAEKTFPGRQELVSLRADYQAALSNKVAASRKAELPGLENRQDRSRTSGDDEKFARAVRTGTASAYAEYLRSFPNGRNASKAMEMLQRLEEEAVAEKSRLEADLDDSAFNTAKLQGTPKALEGYLEDFPSGRHAVEAQGLVASFAEQQKSEPDQPIGKESPQARRAGDIELFKVNGVEIPMAWIPTGTFQMGTTNIEGGRSQRPAHSVTISKGFWIGLYEVTQSQWVALMGDNPSKLKSSLKVPVDSVSWEDCQLFIKELNRLTNRTFRLPTEAEWEYACRAGSADNWYGEWNSIGWHAWNSKGETHEIGQKRPNAFGLYDMIGNVWEWCQDWYASTYYRNSPPVDPPGPSSGKERAVRGGGLRSVPESAHSAIRASVQPNARKDDLGFRLLGEGK